MDNVLNELKKFPNDERTGLALKEQIILSPYNHDRALLVLKARPSFKMLLRRPPGLSKISSSPGVSCIPMPSFKPKVAATPPLPDSMVNTPEMLNTDGQPREKMKGGSKFTTVNNAPLYQPYMDGEKPIYNNMHVGMARRPFGPQNPHRCKFASNAKLLQPLPVVSGSGGGFGWRMRQPV